MSRNIKQYHYKDKLPIEIAANTIEQFSLPTRAVCKVSIGDYNESKYSEENYSELTINFRMKAYEDKYGVELFAKIEDGEEDFSKMLNEEEVCDALYQTCFIDKDVTEHCKYINERINELNGEILGKLFKNTSDIVEGATLNGLGFVKVGNSVLSVIDSITFSIGKPVVVLNNCVGFANLNNIPDCIIEFYTKDVDKLITFNNIKMISSSGEDTTTYEVSSDMSITDNAYTDEWPKNMKKYSSIDDYISDRSTYLKEESVDEDEYSDLIL